MTSPITVSEIFLPPNMVNLYIIPKFMINGLTSYTLKFMIRDLLLVVSWIGCVIFKLVLQAAALISFCCNIFKVCLTILGHYALKG